MASRAPAAVTPSRPMGRPTRKISATMSFSVSPAQAARELLRRRRGRESLTGFSGAVTIPGRPDAAVEDGIAAHHRLLMDAIGGVVGKLAPHLAEYGEFASRKVADYARAWKNPAPAVGAELGRLASKANSSIEELAASLEAAAADGQPQFAVVDALAEYGRDKLAKLASILKPDASKALSVRQNSQSERLGVQMRDAFDAQKTAAGAKRELVESGAPSRSIDAVDAGMHAQGIRADPGKTIPDYLARSADEQSSFRVGYADPHLARLEASAGTAPANRASMLQTERTLKELPVFASPGKGERLMRQNWP